MKQAENGCKKPVFIGVWCVKQIAVSTAVLLCGEVRDEEEQDELNASQQQHAARDVMPEESNHPKSLGKAAGSPSGAD